MPKSNNIRGTAIELIKGILRQMKLFMQLKKTDLGFISIRLTRLKLIDFNSLFYTVELKR